MNAQQRRTRRRIEALTVPSLTANTGPCFFCGEDCDFSHTDAHVSCVLADMRDRERDERQQSIAEDEYYSYGTDAMDAFMGRER